MSALYDWQQDEQIPNHREQFLDELKHQNSLLVAGLTILLDDGAATSHRVAGRRILESYHDWLAGWELVVGL